METVEDEEGRRYVRLKRSSTTSLVHHPEDGETTHIPNERLDTVGGQPPLATAAGAIPGPIRALVTAVHSPQDLGLLIVLAEREPVPVRTLVERTAYCESDLFGILRELAAADLIERADGDAWTLTAAGQAAVGAVVQS